MSRISAANVVKVTATSLMEFKKLGRKISMVTCYDSAFGKLIEASQIDCVLVGDSLGNVMMGYESTIPVTVDDMVHHTACVSRVVKRPFLIADMPFMSYANIDQSLANAAQLIQAGGAHAVKLEGGRAIVDRVQALVRAGIPVVGHLGLMPQSVHALGGYKVQAKTKSQQDVLLDDAKALEEAGAVAVVLEMVPAGIARKVSESLSIPTIGIGAGEHCDGQVLVLHDLLGFDQNFKPKFLKNYANLNQVVLDALESYHSEVQSGLFPNQKHSFQA